jgi:hypothetical protein
MRVVEDVLEGVGDFQAFRNGCCMNERSEKWEGEQHRDGLKGNQRNSEEGASSLAGMVHLLTSLRVVYATMHHRHPGSKHEDL